MGQQDEPFENADRGDRDTEFGRVEAWLERDTTNPNRALAEVRRAFTTLLENIPGMAYRCANDRNWTMEFVSGKADALTGYAPEDLKDNCEIAYGELIHPDDRDGVWAKVQDALGDREAFQLMYRICDRDGQTKWVYEQGCGVFEDGDLEAIEGFITDVTEQRQIEERAFRAQRFSAIARLLEQVGDDFQDQLSIISTYAEMLREDLDENGRLEEDLDYIVEAADRARTLARQLLKFARPEPGEPETIELNMFLDHHEEALASVVGPQAELSIEHGTGIGRVEIDPRHLSDLMIHLVLNACEAIEDGDRGAIVVRSDRVEVDERKAFEHAELDPGTYLTVTVEDDGNGMEEATRQRVFEPYFSTKDEGDGDHRGLGLPTVYGLIRRAGGHVRIASEPGEGTDVTVYLPESG